MRDIPFKTETNECHAIETEFCGYKFRSRLEARWAVFFSVLGIEYKYEFEGFRVKVGPDEFVYYLPDFYLPEYDKYIEVKGGYNALTKDWEKITTCIDYNSTPLSNGLIIVGDIPDYTKIGWGNIPMFSYLYCDKGVRCEHAAFISGSTLKSQRTNNKILFHNNEILENIYGFDECNETETTPLLARTECTWTHESILSFEAEHFKKLKNAYKAARQARFEHGQKGE